MKSFFSIILELYCGFIQKKTIRFNIENNNDMNNFRCISAESSTFEPRIVALEPGPEFKARFEVLEELGKGRFGVVHKVIDKTNEQKLAAKFIKCRTSKDKDKVQDEIDIMNQIRHQKLLQLAAAFEHPKEMIMVTE